MSLTCLGCFFVGFFGVIGLEKLEMGGMIRLFIIVGFIGGFTTFSTFIFETLKLFEDSTALLAFSNIFMSLLFGLIAGWLGIFLAKVVF